MNLSLPALFLKYVMLQNHNQTDIQFNQEPNQTNTPQIIPQIDAENKIFNLVPLN